jgi:excinuclease UvrABC nuclease subunit
MRAASQRLDFEKAAKIRDQIKSIQSADLALREAPPR